MCTDVFEMMVIFLVLRHLPILPGTHVLIQSDNLMAVNCLNLLGSARSRLLNDWTLYSPSSQKRDLPHSEVNHWNAECGGGRLAQALSTAVRVNVRSSVLQKGAGAGNAASGGPFRHSREPSSLCHVSPVLDEQVTALDA